MFTCPICKNETKTLVIPEGGKLAGRCCASIGPKRNNVNLGQTADSWTHIDKKTGNQIKHKLSTGKAWEIENRVVSKDDGKTIINRVTGKPAQL